MRPAHRVIWIDGLGGFLLGTEFPLALGAAHASPRPGVPIQAALKRQHAWITREAEGFCLERGEGLVEMQGRPIAKVLLEDRAKFQLGGQCELEFHQGLPGGGTARLEITRGGRFLFPVRAVLLLSQAFTLTGQAGQGDWLVDGLEQPVSIFKARGGLELRTPAADGTLQRLPLLSGNTIELPELTITLEECV